MNTRLKALEAEYEVDLEKRRKLLASLFEAEQRQHAKEIEALRETPEQVQQRIIDQANQVVLENEAVRKEFVMEKLAERDRLADEALRIKQSKKMTAEAVEGLKWQLQDKQVQKESQVREANEYGKVWEANRLAKIAREERECRERLEAENHVRQEVAEQIAALKQRQEKAKQVQLQEAEESRRKWEEEQRETEAVFVRTTLEKREARLQIQAENKRKQAEKQRLKEQEATLDLALQREGKGVGTQFQAREEIRQKEKAVMVKQQIDLFKQQKEVHRREQARLNSLLLQKQTEEESRLARIRQEKEDNDRRQREWLLNDVQEVRLRQLQEKQTQRECEKQKERTFFEEQVRLRMEEKEQELQLKAQKEQEHREYRAYLKQQLHEQKQRKKDARSL